MSSTKKPTPHFSELALEEIAKLADDPAPIRRAALDSAVQYRGSHYFASKWFKSVRVHAITAFLFGGEPYEMLLDTKTGCILSNTEAQLDDAYWAARVCAETEVDVDYGVLKV